ncbi:MAG: YicC family protein [Synergistaceae bacterium]|nr:YicC family protein [Synergistaceae bacterium]MBQ7169728.1 YicC family protein [Synergistaceae bacterium]
MFISMTGFGSVSHSFPWGSVKFEVSSVNHKYQDFSVKLPREILPLENRILSILRENIVRGKVKLSAEITFNPGAKIPTLDNDSLRVFINQLRTIAKRNSLEAAKDITSFLMIPGVLDVTANVAEQEARDNPEIWDKLTLGAIDAMNEMKRAEGEKLQEKVSTDLAELEGIADSLKERWAVASAEAFEELRTKIQNVMEKCGLDVDEARIAQEIAILSDKWDVSEEVARLEAHTGKFRRVMDETSCGKKLDFLIQEMNREINTMGSKVNDTEFRWLVVEAKACIERMREQIQNIE